jgi:hypothetical protein
MPSKLLELMLCCLFLSPQIHPEEEDYGFEIEEKNKAIVVKSVTRGSHAEVRSLHTHTHTHTHTHRQHTRLCFFLLTDRVH